jgi:hypothetical protein
VIKTLTLSYQEWFSHKHYLVNRRGGFLCPARIISLNRAPVQREV